MFMVTRRFTLDVSRRTRVMALSPIATSTSLGSLTNLLVQSSGHKRHGQSQLPTGAMDTPASSGTSMPGKTGKIGSKLDISA